MNTMMILQFVLAFNFTLGFLIFYIEKKVLESTKSYRFFHAILYLSLFIIIVSSYLIILVDLNYLGITIHLDMLENLGKMLNLDFRTPVPYQDLNPGYYSKLYLDRYNISTGYEYRVCRTMTYVDESSHVHFVGLQQNFIVIKVVMFMGNVIMVLIYQ